jgi:hypothetical protein
MCVFVIIRSLSLGNYEVSVNGNIEQKNQMLLKRVSRFKTRITQANS